MSSKKKKKPTHKAFEEPVEEQGVVEVPLTCTMVGKTMRSAGGYVGVIKSQKYVPSLGMLLVYFENGFVVNSQICKIVE